MLCGVGMCRELEDNCEVLEPNYYIELMHPPDLCTEQLMRANSEEPSAGLEPAGRRSFHRFLGDCVDPFRFRKVLHMWIGTHLMMQKPCSIFCSVYN